VLSRRPKAGYAAELGDWLRGILDVATKFPGCLGVEVVAPDPPHSSDYVMVFQWATKQDFDRWHESAERARWLEHVEGLSDEPVLQTISGLEPWFTLPGTPTGHPPPKWKMAVVTFGVIWPLSTALAFADAPLVKHLELPARTAFTTVLLVPLLTWVVMPRVTQVLSGWLRRPAITTSGSSQPAATGRARRGRRRS
jgi:antibiotic biosynthesis monooxygenase (ABM) superfamily enzyme